MARRHLIGSLAAGLGLAGCSLKNSPFYGTILNFNRRAGPAIDRAKIDSIPYASMLAHFQGNVRALIVLGEYGPNGRLIWYSAEHQALTTWGPFVVRLLGLDPSLRMVNFEGNWSSDLRTMIGRKLWRSFEFQSGSTLTTIRARSTFHRGGVEEVEILGKKMRLLKVSESLLASGGHHFTNTYWIDEGSGFCWKSRQMVIPTMTMFDIEIAKRPRGA